jgi:serine protease Do
MRPPAAGGRCLWLVIILALTLATGAANAQADRPADFSDLVKAKLPSVVTVTSTREIEPDQRIPMPQFPPDWPFGDFFDNLPGMPPGGVPPDRPARALGSGFIIDPAGYIVTNNHVIEGADEIEVVLNDDSELPAQLVGTDPATDLALLKVEPDNPLPALEWGDSGAAEVGDWIVAIGNPFGLGGSVSAGIISATARDIHAGPYDDFIQTDAAINQGNSGGPVFAMDGKVIGVATAIFSQSGGNIGIGFAIPSALARPVIEQLREHGEVPRGWLGVQIQPVTDEIAEALGLKDTAGALVSRVVPDSPAAEAGLQVGDLIVRFDGRDVQDARALQRIVAEAEIGSSAEVTVRRDDSTETLTVTVGRLEIESQQASAAPTETDPGRIGMALAPLTPEMREQFGITEGTGGALVADIAQGSPAAEAGLQPGDVITRVGSTEVQEPEDVVTAIEEARQAGRSSVLLLTERNGQAVFLPLEIG